MASISAAGLGSGLDLNSLVTQLVAAERAPAENRLNREQSTVNAQISALGALTSTSKGLQSALTRLANGLAFGGRSATSNSDHFSGSATDQAQTGSYQIRVESLATQHRLASAPVADATAPFGSGELSLSLGAESFVIDFSAGASLSEIRDAINDAEDNPGISASILNGADGARLVLGSSKSGSANNIQVVASGGDGGLSTLAYESGGVQNLSQVQPALDAEVYIDGFLVSSAGNQITDAIEGVTLNLSAAEPGVNHTLTVANDHSAAVSALESFVSSYNVFVATAATVTRYDPASNQAASLVGDPAVRSLGNRLRSLVGGEIANGDGPSLLSQIGLSIKTDGSLTLDKTALETALNENPDGVKTLFAGKTNSEGLADQLDVILESYVGTTGVFTSRSESVKSRLDQISDQREVLDRRIAALQSQYQARFSSLDTLISQLQSTGNYLTQQLSNLSA